MTEAKTDGDAPLHLESESLPTSLPVDTGWTVELSPSFVGGDFHMSKSIHIEGEVDEIVATALKRARRKGHLFDAPDVDATDLHVSSLHVEEDPERGDPFLSATLTEE